MTFSCSDRKKKNEDIHCRPGIVSVHCVTEVIMITMLHLGYYVSSPHSLADPPTS